MRPFIASVMLLVIPGSAPAAELADRLTPLVKAHRGRVAVAVKHLKTGVEFYHQADEPMPAVPVLHETHLDALFEACAEAVEQAIVHAMWRAASVTGRDGHRRRSIAEALPDWRCLIGPIQTRNEI